MMRGLSAAAVCALALTTFACSSMQSAAEPADGADGATLTQRVESRLAADPAVAQLGIEVSAQGDVVTLSGKLDDPKAARQALDIAGKTPGVDGLVNRLVVPPPQEQVDAALATAVAEALQTLDGADIRVEVKDSAATLYGKVPSREAHKRALDIADAVDGVSQVKDALRVSG